MSCKLPYINDWNSSIGTTLPNNIAGLHEIHVQAMKDILAAQYIVKDGATAINKGQLFTPYTNKEGVKFLILASNDEKQRKQLAFLEELNKEYNIKLNVEGGVSAQSKDKEKIALIKSAPTNPGGKPIEVVTVSLLNYLERFDEDKFNEAADSFIENYDQYMDSALFDPDYIQSSSSIIESASENSGEVFEAFTKIKDILAPYKLNFIEGKRKNRVFQYEDKNLNSLLWTIYNIKTPEDALFYFSKLFKTSSGVQKSLKTKILTEGLLNQIKNIKADDKFATNVVGAATKINEATQLIAYMKPLEELFISLRSLKGNSFWESYNKIRIEQELFNPEIVAVEYHEALKGILKATNINDVATIINTLQAATGVNRTAEIEKIFNDSYVDESLSNLHIDEFLSTASKIKTNLKEAHYELLGVILENKEVEIVNRRLYADYSKSTDPNKVVPEKITTIDKAVLSTLLPAKFVKGIKTKDQIKAVLLNSEKDISWWNSWLGAGYELEDDAANMIVNFITDEIRKGDLDNTRAMADFEAKFKAFKLTQEEREALENKLIQPKKYIPKGSRLVEADDEYIQSLKPTHEAFGKIFKVFEDKFLITEKDTNVWQLDKAAHFYTLKERATNILALMSSTKKGAILDMSSLSLTDQTSLLNSHYLDDFGQMQKLPDSIEQLKGLLTAGLYGQSLHLKSKKQINEVLSKPLGKEVTADNLLEELNRVDSQNSKLFRMLFHHGSVKGSLVKDQNIVPDRLLGNSLSKGVIVQKNGKYEYAPLEELESGKGTPIYRLDKKYIDEQYTVYYLEHSFNTLVGYDSPEHTAMRQSFTPNEKDYHDFIHETYDAANSKYGDNMFNYGLLPFVDKAETKTLIEKFKDPKEAIGTWWEGMKFKTYNATPRYNPDKEGPKYLDDNNNPTDDISKASYVRKTDQFDDPFLEIQAPYTQKRYAEQEQATDLIVSMGLFTHASIEYEKLAQLDMLMPLVKSVITNNGAIGIEQRKAKETSHNGTFLRKAIDVIATKKADNTAAALMSFINNTLYGADFTDISVAGVSSKQIANTIKGTIAYQVIANNWIAAGTNLGFGTISNYLVSFSKITGLSPQAIRDAYKIYGKNTINFVADASKSTLAETSKYTQLGVLFKALKGGKEDGRVFVDRKDKLSSVIGTALYASSTLPEHTNQLSLMIALLHNHKITNTTNFMDYVIDNPGELVTFDYAKLDAIGYSKEDWEGVILNLTKKIELVNYEAHGQYSHLMKNRIQENALGSLAWQFGKWMYSGYKARFRDEKFQRLAEDTVEEGYLKTYFRFLMNDIQDMNGDWHAANFLEDFIKYAKVNKVKTLKTLSEAGAKQLLGVIDTLTFRFASKNLKIKNENDISDWLYGAEQEVKDGKMRIMRANMEITYFIATMIIAYGLKAAADGEEEDGVKKKILRNLELQAKRIHGDLGFYLVYTSPTSFGDKLLQKMKDPSNLARTFEKNYSVAKQLMGWEYTDEGVDFKFNDVYSRRGPGYEQGDYKLTRKLEKTIFAPIGQIYKLLAPEEQLSYIDNVLYK